MVSRLPFVFSLSLFILAGSRAATVEVQDAAGPRAPDFKLVDVNPRSRTHGQALSLRELYAPRGVVLEFIASWCASCRKQLPELESLRSSGRAPIVFMAADEEGGKDSLLIIAERAKVKAPILFVPSKDRAEFESHWTYEILPATYVIDRQGTIRKVFQGVVSQNALLREIDRSQR